MTLDLRKLEHLIAVAEEGSVTRAARRLHLTQQALSSSIRSLEREVGVDLLARGGNAVTVLPPGQALIDDARVLHGAANAALRRARRIGRGEAEILRIGHTPAVTGEEVTELLRANRAMCAEFTAEVRQNYPSELAAQLVGGELDLGLCRAMRPERGLVSRALTGHRLRVAVAADHRWAGRESVALTELAEESIMVWGRPGESGYTDLLLEHCRRAGFEPHVQRNPVQGTPPVTAVLGTGHVAFVTAAAGSAADGQVRVLDLEPNTHVPLQAIWAEHTSSPVRDAFLDGVPDST